VTDQVTLRHPTLPAEQTIRVDRRRMGTRLAAGWEEIEAPAKPEPKRPAEPVTEPTDSASKRRGRKTSEEL
jgi:hypothetical protein